MRYGSGKSVAKARCLVIVFIMTVLDDERGVHEYSAAPLPDGSVKRDVFAILGFDVVLQPLENLLAINAHPAKSEINRT